LKWLSFAGAVVLEHMNRRANDLLVLGDSGRRKQLDLGGLARAMFARAPCPVWLQVEPPRKLERILVPIDLSESSKVVLARGIALAKRVGARVHALECFVNPELYYGAGMDVPAGPPPLDNLRNVNVRPSSSSTSSRGRREHSAGFIEEDPAPAILGLQDGLT
jgi:nucleotide-binding universal stress UspA family protein